MRGYPRIWYFGFLAGLLLASFSGQTQTFPSRFFSYGPEHGFQPSYIHKLVFDQDGMLWIGTGNGLYRFDGYEFEVFKEDLEDPGSFPLSNAIPFGMDRAGNILLNDGYRLFQFDPRTFAHAEIRLYEQGNQEPAQLGRMLSLKQMAPGTFWCLTDGAWVEVYDYDPVRPDSATIRKHIAIPGHPELKPDGTLLPYLLEEKNRLWLGGRAGLVIWELDKGEATYLKPGAPGGLLEPVRGITPGKDTGTYWLPTLSGLNTLHVDPSQETYTADLAIPRFPVEGSPNENAYTYVHVDRRGLAWVGSFRHGLFVIDPRTGARRNYLPDPADRQSFPSTMVYDIQEDPAGNIWIGHGGGLSMVPAHRYGFEVYPDPQNPEEVLQGEHVYGFAEDQNSNLWVANREGLTRIHEEKGEYETIGARQGMDWVFAVDLYCDSNNDLWVFSKGALQKLDLKTRRFTNYLANGLLYDEISTLEAMSLTADAEEKLWLSVYGGVLQFDPPTKTFTEFPGHPKMYYNILSISPGGDVWVGDSKQIHRINRATKVYETFSVKDSTQLDLNGNSIRDIHISHDSLLWVGTVNGLFRVNPQRGTLTYYSQEDGLLNSYVRGIEEDDQGRIWIANDGGLSRLDPEKEIFTNYSYQENFDVFFYSRASFRRNDGRMYFGGSKGFVQFHPDSIKPDPYAAPAYLRGLSIFNEPVPLARDSVKTTHGLSLAKPLRELASVTLDHRHRTFSISFSVLNYAHPERCRFAYKMEGYDPGWTETNAYNRQATYTNLDPGTYTFKVKAGNHDGVWNEEAATLKVTIRPPWYRSALAIWLYILGATALLSLYVYYRIAKVRREYETLARIERAKEEEREGVRKQSARDFHDEAGNKLTKLSLYVGLLRQRFANDPEGEDLVANMERNLGELSTGMRDFIWVLDPEKDSLAETLQRLATFGESLFRASQTRFSARINDPAFQHISLDIKDKRHLLLIFKEAMNNCLKYAGATEARLEAYREGIYAVVKFEDNGQGFEEKSVGQGYGLKNMESRARESGARLRVESAPGEGTTIWFRKEIHPDGA